MNAIFGFLSANGAPLAPERLTYMSQALTHWAVDGLATWQEGSVGLGCAALHSTPEALDESLPLHDPRLGLTLTAGARLDYRDALVADLRLLIDEWFSKSAFSNQPPSIPDSLLILLAYQKWGVDCVHHLLGDWHFALWDAPQRRLFVARDHHGQTGLYYYEGLGWLAFASSKKALLALPDLPQHPHVQRLAETLISQPGDGIQTAYEGIQRLPPAHRMSFSPAQGGLRVERYWRLEDTPLMHLDSDEAYAEGLMQVFTQAVQARLRCRRPVGTTLSGGLDSGAVTAVAARLLALSGESLVSYTSVPLNDPAGLTGRRFGDEWEFASQTARQAKNIEHIAIRAGHISPLAGLEQMLAIHDEPGHAAGNAFWLSAILEAARQCGLGALLIGQGGNATISWVGGEHSLWPFLLTGDWSGFWRAIEREARAQAISRAQVVRRTVIKPLLLPVWTRLKAAGRSLNPWLSPEWTNYSALRQDAGRRLGLTLATMHGDKPYFDPPAMRYRAIHPGASPIGHLWMENGANFALEARDPTSDRRVLEYCLATPDQQFRSDGLDRSLLRRAMQGYLPDAVRLNRQRGLQSADLGYRVLENQAEIASALARCASHPLCQEILDFQRMQSLLESLARGVTMRNSLECGTVLLRGLGVGLFLARF